MTEADGNDIHPRKTGRAAREERVAESDRAALATITAEREAREAKTARLKALRLAREADRKR